MSLTAAEIQKTLEASMLSIQAQMDAERESYKKRIQKLEEGMEEKDKEINELKESLVSKKKDNEVINLMISKLNTQIRDKEKIIEEKIKEHQNDIMEQGTLKNQIQLKDNEIMNLNLEKKKINEDWENKNDMLKNQLFSLQKKLDESLEDKVKIQNEIKEKDKIISEKEQNIEELKESLVSKKKDNEMINLMISKLNTQIRDKEKIIEEKIKEHQNDVMKQGTLKNQIQLKDNEIMNLNLEKKKINEEWENKNEMLKNQLFSLQKKLDESVEDKVKIQNEISEKDKIISEKDQNIEELKEKIKKIEENNKNLLVYVKEMKEKEEILKKEKEDIKKEKDKLNQEIIDKKKLE